MKVSDQMFITIIIATFIVFGAGMYVVGNAGHNSAAPSASTSSYNLTLVITHKNYYNSSITSQPRYYVLEGNQLVSSANIYVPSYATIHLTIIDYDNGNATAPPQYLNVMGTQNNMEFIVNQTNAHVTNQSSTVGSYTHQVSAASIAHTFTLFNKNNQEILNVPSPYESTVYTTFTTQGAGYFTWQCEADCGSGASGWGGAMVTPGWMTGSFIVQ